MRGQQFIAPSEASSVLRAKNVESWLMHPGLCNPPASPLYRYARWLPSSLPLHPRRTPLETPQPGGDVSTCQRGVTGCRGVSRDVTEMSWECRRNVEGCRGLSLAVAGMSRDVAGCRRSSTCHQNVTECRRCHGNVADVARMSPECRGNVAGCHRGVTECQLPSHLDQRVDMSTHPHQAGG